MIGPRYRFVVLVDVAGDSLPSAYSQLHKRMGEAFPGDWETADEAFDEDGNPVEAADFEHARMQSHWRAKPNPAPDELHEMADSIRSRGRRTHNPGLKQKLMR